MANLQGRLRTTRRGRRSPAPAVRSTAGWLPESGRRGSVVERRDGVVARGEDREDLVEAGDLEGLGDVLVDVDDDQRALARPQPLDGADEHAERGGVQKRRVAEVDDDAVLARLDGVGELLLELGRGEQVDLAAYGDDVAVGVQGVFGESELGGHERWIVAGGAAGGPGRVLR